jgi:hypothetical protein
MKSKLAGLSLTQESFQKNKEGVVQKILQDECKKKCVWIDGDYVEK